jgi:hypothetical protein
VVIQAVMVDDPQAEINLSGIFYLGPADFQNELTPIPFNHPSMSTRQFWIRQMVVVHFLTKGVPKPRTPIGLISRKSQCEIGSAVGAQRQTDYEKISQTDAGYTYTALKRRCGGWVHYSPMDGTRIAILSTPLKWNGNSGLKDK